MSMSTYPVSKPTTLKGPPPLATDSEAMSPMRSQRSSPVTDGDGVSEGIGVDPTVVTDVVDGEVDGWAVDGVPGTSPVSHPTTARSTDRRMAIGRIAPPSLAFAARMTARTIPVGYADAKG
jgi:hypothetical protein